MSDLVYFHKSKLDALADVKSKLTDEQKSAIASKNWKLA